MHDSQVLQQGPPHVLSECTTYAPVVEEIGQMWGPDHVGTTSVSAIPGAGDMGAAAATGGGDKSGGVGAGGVVDPALSLLILRFATMIVQKVSFGVGGVCGFWWFAGMGAFCLDGRVSSQHFWNGVTIRVCVFFFVLGDFSQIKNEQSSLLYHVYYCSSSVVCANEKRTR